MRLLDTSVLIELFRTKNKMNTLFFRLSADEEPFVVSAITHYEIYIGAHIEQMNFWNSFFNEVKIIPFDGKCSQMAVEIYKNLKIKNQLIALPDLLIGATALAHELPIATLNVKHFERIENLKIIE